MRGRERETAAPAAYVSRVHKKRLWGRGAGIAKTGRMRSAGNSDLPSGE